MRLTLDVEPNSHAILLVSLRLVVVVDTTKEPSDVAVLMRNNHQCVTLVVTLQQSHDGVVVMIQ